MPLLNPIGGVTNMAKLDDSNQKLLTSAKAVKNYEIPVPEGESKEMLFVTFVQTAIIIASQFFIDEAIMGHIGHAEAWQEKGKLLLSVLDYNIEASNDGSS